MRVFLEIAQQVIFKFCKAAPQTYKGRFQPVARVGESSEGATGTIAAKLSVPRVFVEFVLKLVPAPYDCFLYALNHSRPKTLGHEKPGP